MTCQFLLAASKGSGGTVGVVAGILGSASVLGATTLAGLWTFLYFSQHPKDFDKLKAGVVIFGVIIGVIMAFGIAIRWLRAMLGRP